MATSERTTSCTVVLHDDTVSPKGVLCGANTLPMGTVAFIHASNTKRLCIHADTSGGNPNEISINMSVARHFGFENRMKASVQIVDDIESATATHVELLFRDQHLSRADMWRIKAQIDSSVLYQSQKLKYLGSVTATVEAIYISGQQVQSAFVSNPQTKLIFRSSSARFTIMIQISKEMLEYWNHDGSLMYETLIDEFLPELFRRWTGLKVRHQVSVVLFGRRLIPSRTRPLVQEGTQLDDVQTTEGEDFYHVVTSSAPSSDNRDLLRRLKKAFNSDDLPRQVSLAAQGNMLQAIHLAAMDFADETCDPTLNGTGTSIVAITAGAGLFETQHDILKRTTELLMGNSIGADIVSLSPKPFHPVPLFFYEMNGRSEYALPHWVDISYWRATSVGLASKWLLTNGAIDVNGIAISQIGDMGKALSVTPLHALDVFDEHTFSDSTATAIVHGPIAVDPPVAENNTDPNGRSTSWIKDAYPSTPPIENSAPANNGAEGSSKLTTKRNETSFKTPHPLMQMGRRVSLGPKGLALRQGVASTTVSAQHARHEREVLNGPTSASNEANSDLAKQIRATIKRRPTQTSTAQGAALETAVRSDPINIQAPEEIPIDEHGDPASLIEKVVMEQAGQSGQGSSSSLSPTPKARTSPPLVSELNPIEEENGTVSPWLTLLNPCNPRKSNMRVANEYRQWQHIFPKTVSSGAFKWESICTPASLPLMTERRISQSDLESRFHRRVRRMVATNAHVSNSSPAHQVMLQMIAMRLAAGFQIVPRRKFPHAQIPSEQIDGILLSLGGQYHDLRCLSTAEVQVIEYDRLKETKLFSKESPGSAAEYSVKIRPAAAHKSRRAKASLGQRYPTPDWSPLDDQSVNPAALNDNSGIRRMRFVLIPVEPPRMGSHGTAGTRGLSDDERRIEGIQKLTQLWQRHRHFSTADQQHHASMVRPKPAGVVDRDPNPLAIEYITRDTSVFVSTYGMYPANEFANGEVTAKLSSELESYHSNDFDIAKLVKHMQEPPPNGVELRDRRWFTRLHLKCFRGDEMTNWLLRVFKDLETREDAVALGNQLMERGIFSHVRGKHEFRDGHYFYQIKSAHRTTPYPDSAGLFDKAVGLSAPSTPMADMKQSPSIRPIRGESDSSGKGTPTLKAEPVDKNEKIEVVLSQKLQYNVDSTRKSNQLEIINLHYSCFHNPENCYHIHLDWTCATPKLIRESVVRWSALVESHGHKLVQLPVKEACRVHEQHPFDQPIPVKLPIRPPDRIPTTPQLQGDTFSPRAAQDPHKCHKAVLQELDFVLDFESAKSFPRELDVSYSWGRPDYKFSQFIHKSGLLLAQISDDGESDFLLLPNRLAPHPSTASSKKADVPSTEEIVRNFQAFCKDEATLRLLFEVVHKANPSAPSPFPNTVLATNNDIPPFELPPVGAHRAVLRNIS